MKTQNPRGRCRLPVTAMLTIAMVLLPGAIECRAQMQYPRHDFQSWAAIDATHRLNEKADFLLSTGIRYSNDQGHLGYRRITTGFAFHYNKFLTFEPYYQYSQSDSFSGPITPENRLAFATTVGTAWKHWTISDRNLGERRFKEKSQAWRYRNRVELSHPLNLERKRVSVFVWDEVYYSSRARRWYRNRFALGAGQKVGKRVSVDVYYVHQNDGFSHPGDLSGVGMTIKTSF